MITARYHREIPQRYRLEASECSKCGKASFPPRLVCPACKGKEMKKISLKDEGTLETFTVINVGSEDFAHETPYVVGIVALDKGVKITTQIVTTSHEDLKIGQDVKMVFRRIRSDGKAGIICYGYKAVVA